MITKNFNILNELKEAGAENLVMAGKAACFSVPDNYFNTLPENVMAHIFLQSLSYKNPYTTPEGYFDEFPKIMLATVSATGIMLPDATIATYTVPEHYFGTLADSILNRIKKQAPPSEVQEELETISPLLSSIPKTNVYTVPGDYFESIKTSPVNKQPEPAKIIPFRHTRRWINYAAAACIAILLLGGSYLFLNKNSIETTAAVEPAVNVEQQISGLSDEEITSYLQANSNTAVYTNSTGDAQSNEMQNMLQNVSDEEIEQYLNQHPESMQAEEGI